MKLNLPSQRDQNQQSTVSIDYDTYMLSTMSLRENTFGMYRSQSQGKINVAQKDFDAKTLLLPEIFNKGDNKITSALLNEQMPQIGYRLA